MAIQGPNRRLGGGRTRELAGKLGRGPGRRFGETAWIVRVEPRSFRLLRRFFADRIRLRGNTVELSWSYTAVAVTGSPAANVGASRAAPTGASAERRPRLARSAA